MPVAIFDDDFRKAYIAATFNPVTDGIARAIAEERERCANVAENFNAAGKPIADEIRRNRSARSVTNGDRNNG